MSFVCGLCGKSGADNIHHKYTILCDECLVKQPPICDFCSATDVKWRYEVESFMVKDDPIAAMGGPANRSVADWAACDECHELIENEEYSKLTLRSVESSPGWKETAPAIKRRILEMLGGMHLQFIKGRLGPPTPEPTNPMTMEEKVARLRRMKEAK